jgi:hypothetical protein
VFFLNPDFGWAVGRNMIATMTWRSLPALIEFDAVNKSDGIEIVGKIAPTLLPMRVKKLEYMVDKSNGFQILQKSAPLYIDHGQFKFQWDPHGAGFRDGTSFRYQVILTDGIFDYPQKIDSVFVYKSWLGKFEEDHPFLIPSVIVVFFLMCALLVPEVLFRAYRVLPWKAVSETLGHTTFGKIAIMLCSLVVVPYFFRLRWIVRAWTKRYAAGKLQLSDLGPDIRADYIKRAPVLDAWVRRHLTRAQEHHAKVLEQVSKGGLYIPMPISIGGNKLEVPTRDQFAWMVSDEAFTILVTGPGGSGKSTFAAQLGRWALQGLASATGGLMLPIFLRQPTTDLSASVKGVLMPVVEYDDDLDDALLTSVIRRKRLLIIVDSLSEWPEPERDYVENIRAKMPVGALVVTSRRSIDYDKAREVSL